MSEILGDEIDAALDRDLARTTEVFFLYQASHDPWVTPILMVKVDGERGMSFLINGRYIASTRTRKFFNSFEGARQWLLEMAQKDINAARKTLIDKQDRFDRIYGLADDGANK